MDLLYLAGRGMMGFFFFLAEVPLALSCPYMTSRARIRSLFDDTGAAVSFYEEGRSSGATRPRPKQERWSHVHAHTHTHAGLEDADGSAVKADKK